MWCEIKNVEMRKAEDLINLLEILKPPQLKRMGLK